VHEVFIPQKRENTCSLPEFLNFELFDLFTNSSLFTRVSDFEFCCLFSIFKITSRVQPLKTPVRPPGGRVIRETKPLNRGKETRVSNRIF
jgi:hypothetical protein